MSWGAPRGEREDEGTSDAGEAPRRPAAWGAEPEPREPGGAASRRPSSGASGGVSLVTLGLGLVALAFGLWVVARRWTFISNGLDLYDMSSGVRDVAASLSGLQGLPSFDGLFMPYERLALPTIAGGVLGLLAGALFVVIGALVLLKSGLAVRPGARGLLVAAGLFTLAHACDIWTGVRIIDMHEEALRRAQSVIGGGDRVRATIAAAYQSMAAPATPSLSDFVMAALVWVVPVLIVAIWAARYLESAEVRASLGRR